jgi:hypothetical protein
MELESMVVKDNPITRAMVEDDVCPRCLGELDTGWECNDCCYDAEHLAGEKE